MKNSQAAVCYNLKGVSKKHYKKIHNRAMRRNNKLEIPQYNRFSGWAD